MSPNENQNANPRIALVSAAGSGTTQIVRMASILENLYVIRNEWLDGLGVAWAQEEELAEFRRLNGVDYTDHEDARLRSWVRDNMDKTLQILESHAAPTDWAVF